MRLSPTAAIFLVLVLSCHNLPALCQGPTSPPEIDPPLDNSYSNLSQGTTTIQVGMGIGSTVASVDNSPTTSSVGDSTIDYSESDDPSEGSTSKFSTVVLTSSDEVMSTSSNFDIDPATSSSTDIASDVSLAVAPSTMASSSEPPDLATVSTTSDSPSESPDPATKPTTSASSPESPDPATKPTTSASSSESPDPATKPTASASSSESPNPATKPTTSASSHKTPVWNDVSLDALINKVVKEHLNLTANRLAIRLEDRPIRYRLGKIEVDIQLSNITVQCLSGFQVKEVTTFSDNLTMYVTLKSPDIKIDTFYDATGAINSISSKFIPFLSRSFPRNATGTVTIFMTNTTLESKVHLLLSYNDMVLAIENLDLDVETEDTKVEVMEHSYPPVLVKLLFRHMLHHHMEKLMETSLKEEIVGELRTAIWDSVSDSLSSISLELTSLESQLSHMEP